VDTGFMRIPKDPQITFRITRFSGLIASCLIFSSLTSWTNAASAVGTTSLAPGLSTCNWTNGSVNSSLVGMGEPVVKQLLGDKGQLTQPIYSEPIERYVVNDPGPATYRQFEMRNAKFPIYRTPYKDSSTQNAADFPLTELIETMSWFKSLRNEHKFFGEYSQLAVGDPQPGTGVVLVNGESYYGIGLKNQYYEIETTLPAAPRLVFVVVEIGHFVLSFAFYGGDQVSIAKVSNVVNLGIADFIATCK